MLKFYGRQPHIAFLNTFFFLGRAGRAAPRDDALSAELGALAARVQAALREFDHELLDVLDRARDASLDAVVDEAKELRSRIKGAMKNGARG